MPAFMRPYQRVDDSLWVAMKSTVVLEGYAPSWCIGMTFEPIDLFGLCAYSGQTTVTDTMGITESDPRNPDAPR